MSLNVHLTALSCYRTWPFSLSDSRDSLYERGLLSILKNVKPCRWYFNMSVTANSRTRKSSSWVGLSLSIEKIFRWKWTLGVLYHHGRHEESIIAHRNWCLCIEWTGWSDLHAPDLDTVSKNESRQEPSNRGVALYKAHVITGHAKEICSSFVLFV